MRQATGAVLRIAAWKPTIVFRDGVMIYKET